MPDPRSITDVRAMATRMRRNILAMTFGTGQNGAHVAPALSIVEICAVLYGAVMKLDFRNPLWPDRDRFLLSKGHGALALYAALAEAGFLTLDELRTFEAPESLLSGQPTMCVEKGIEISSGSLGLGLSVGIGIALAGKEKRGAATGLSSCWAMASATRERSGKRPWRQLISNWAA